MNKILTILILIIVFGISNTKAIAKSEVPTATCTIWDSNQPFPLHRCEDEDGTVCIKSDSGMFQCNFE